MAEKDVTPEQVWCARDMSIEELNQKLKELQSKLPDPNITKPADWNIEHKRAYVQHNFLSNYMGERIKEEFKEKHGF